MYRRRHGHGAQTDMRTTRRTDGHGDININIDTNISELVMSKQKSTSRDSVQSFSLHQLTSTSEYCRSQILTIEREMDQSEELDLILEQMDWNDIATTLRAAVHTLIGEEESFPCVSPPPPPAPSPPPPPPPPSPPPPAPAPEPPGLEFIPHQPEAAQDGAHGGCFPVAVRPQDQLDYSEPLQQSRRQCDLYTQATQANDQGQVNNVLVLDIPQHVSQKLQPAGFLNGKMVYQLPAGFSSPPVADAPSMAGTPPMGAAPSMAGTPPMGAAPSMAGTPPMGAAPSMAGTPPMGAAPSMAGTPLMADAPSMAGTPPMGAASSMAAAPLLQTSGSKSKKRQREAEEDEPLVKKPLNAFMMFMKEQRPNISASVRRKGSAAVNAALGQMWGSLTIEQQAGYYQQAFREKMLHAQLHPGWSSKDNYGKKKKRVQSNAPRAEAAVSRPEDDLQHVQRVCKVLPPNPIVVVNLQHLQSVQVLLPYSRTAVTVPVCNTCHLPQVANIQHAPHAQTLR